MSAFWSIIIPQRIDEQEPSPYISVAARRSSVTTYRNKSRHGPQFLLTQPSLLLSTFDPGLGNLFNWVLGRLKESLVGQEGCPGLDGASMLVIVNRRRRYQWPSMGVQQCLSHTTPLMAHSQISSQCAAPPGQNQSANKAVEMCINYHIILSKKSSRGQLCPTINKEKQVEWLKKWVDLSTQ